MSLGLSPLGLVPLGLGPPSAASSGGGTGTPTEMALFAGLLPITGYAPAISQAVQVAIGAGTLNVTGHAPAISQASGISLLPGSLSITGYAPAIAQATNLALLPGALAVTGYAPQVEQAATTPSTSISLAPGSLNVTGYAPSVAQANGVQLQTGGLPITGYAPTVAQTAPAARYARPMLDITAGGWTPSTGTALAPMLNEATPNDSTYISTSAPSTCEIRLNAVVDPNTSSGQVVRYKAGSSSGNGVIVRFKQGVTTIAQWTHATLPAAQTLFTQTLTAQQCDAITDYGDLRFEFEAI